MVHKNTIDFLTADPSLSDSVLVLIAGARLSADFFFSILIFVQILLDNHAICEPPQR